MQVIARVEQDDSPAASYPRFHAAVARAQLTRWLPDGSRCLLDISGPGARAAEAAVRAGHRVLRVLEPGQPVPPESPRGLCRVSADGPALSFLPDGCVDGVIAEDGALSLRLAAEDLVAEVARVLRPGGRVLACVDSLTFGMAMLAEQHRWPSLVDVPKADVVLVPWPDGTITRCYGAEQLRELFTGAGLEVSWIRPRTVLSPQTVDYLLARDPSTFSQLVEAELHASADDSVGTQLVASCVKRSALEAPLPVVLGLARHAPRRGGAGLEAGLGNQPAAVNALPVAALLDPGERRQHLTLPDDHRLHGGGVPVGLRQVRPGVARLGAAVAVQVLFTVEYRDRSLQVGTHFL